MKKFLLSMTMLSFIATPTNAMRITPDEFLEDLIAARTSQQARAPRQETEFVNDRDSAQFLRNIAEGSGRAMFVLPIVVLILTSGKNPQMTRGAIVGLPDSITETGMPTSWADMDKIWHLTFGGEVFREPVREPQGPRLGLNQPPVQLIQAENNEQALKGLKAQQRDAQKRLKRALRQQTKSHSHPAQNHKSHKGSRFAGQSMKQHKSQSGR